MKFNTINFEDWFSTDLPNKWEFVVEGDCITFYNTINPKGVFQVSCYIMEDVGTEDDEIAMEHLDSFINQFEINIDIYTKKILQTPKCTFALTEGTTADNRFWRIWVVIFNDRMLMCTYNSGKKTREVNVVDDIVFGIEPC